MRDRIIEVMAEALCFVGKTCDRRCPDVDHRPCPDALSSWGQDAKRALSHLQAEGMTVVPVETVKTLDDHVGSLLRILEDAPYSGKADAERVLQIATAFGERCLAAAHTQEKDA